MDDSPFRGLILTFGMICSAFLVGAAFTYGCAIVCRRLKWAPMNVTVNITNKVEKP
jgi:hypothetical protein